MSAFETPVKLGRELFEINTNVARRMAEIAGEGIKQYFETNQEFAQKLTEVRDVTAFFELQRDYGKTLYTSATDRLQTQGDVVKEAFELSGEAMRTAFNPTNTANTAPEAELAPAEEIAA